MNIMSLINALPGAVAQGLIWGIMAIGVYLTFRILDFADLTVDGSLCTGGAVCIMMMLGGCNVWLALLCALLAGMATGLATGLLHTFMGIPAILSGILTQLGLYSINLKIMGKANQAINVDKFDLLVSLRFIKGVPFFKNTIFVVAVVLGCNDKMARAQGINTDFNRVLCLMLSNGLVAFSGALLAQYQGFSDVQMGRGAIVIGLAAVIIGEAAFGKIFHNFGFRLLGVALGSIIYYLVLQVVIWRGIDTDLLKLLSAVVVAVFLAIPTWKRRYLQSSFRAKKPAAAGKERA